MMAVACFLFIDMAGDTLISQYDISAVILYFSYSKFSSHITLFCMEIFNNFNRIDILTITFLIFPSSDKNLTLSPERYFHCI